MARSISIQEKMIIICLIAEIEALEELINHIEKEIDALYEGSKNDDQSNFNVQTSLIQLRRNHQR